MHGRVILVTGSTDGIGKQTALALARMGAPVLVHGRNHSRGEQTVEEIRRATGNDHVELIIADLSSLAQVRTLATEVKQMHDRLHVLINNAGVLMRRRELSVDGYEMTFAVNHLAPFLLTNLLLDVLQAGATVPAPARIVNLSSTTHQGARLDFDNLQGAKQFDGHSVYALSKLCNILFTNELARRLKGTNVIANSLHPGVINTKLLRAGYPAMGAVPEAGAETPVYLAMSPEVTTVSGKYFIHKRAVEPSSSAQDHELQAKLWEISEKLVGLA